MSDESTTPDFAFEPPAMVESSSANTFDGFNNLKTPTFPSTGVSPSGFSSNTNGGFAQPFPPTYAYSNPSSFSSSAASGASFSSVDALPAISRDFVRPSTTETRRPATAGGALQSFGLVERDERPETIDETSESIFSNPFESHDGAKQINSHDSVDPHASRRPSEYEADLSAQSAWTSSNTPTGSTSGPSPHQQYPLSSAPPQVTHFNMINPQMNVHSQLQQLARQGHMPFGARPQTSDGLPSYGSIGPNGVSLPSARTIVNQIGQAHGLNTPNFYGGPSLPPSHQQQPYRDNRSASMSDVQPQVPSNAFPGNRHYSMSDKYAAEAANEKSELTFVALGGPAPKKRPRRRYDEIERLYQCGWNGCEKSYGTLNHLNAHVAMQKHGEKRLPSEFKDMRKAWRKKKREQSAVAANAQYMATTTTWNARPSIGSSGESDFDRRDSAVSAYSTSDVNSHRGSVVYAPGYGWNAGDSRPSTSSSVASSADGRFPINGGSAYANGMINPSPAVRRPSAPAHMMMGQAGHMFRPEDLSASQQNPYARPGSAHAGYPFQTLTQPMLAGGQAGQFAFQR